MTKSIHDQIRQRALDAQREANALLQKRRRQVQEDEYKKILAAKANQDPADGVPNALRAQLIAAEKKREEDPRFQQFTNQVILKRRIEEARKGAGITDVKPAPETEVTSPVALTPTIPVAEEPQTVGERRKKNKNKDQ